MTEPLCLSVIVPVYNAKNYLQRCIDNLLDQDFKKSYEVIFVDDASTDNSLEIILKKKSDLIKILRIHKNSGPASARNEGLKIAKGEFVYFMDVDDTITKDCLSLMFIEAKKFNFDIVISDKKNILGSKNYRENNFLYQNDKTFDENEITEQLKKRLYNPLYNDGLVGVTGKLFKKSIIKSNNLFFQKDWRYLEDEVFSYDFLSFCKKAKYIRKQLYCYHIYENVSTGISAGIEEGFKISNFIITKKSVYRCFKKRGLTIQECEKLANHALIYYVIGLLISYSRSIILKKSKTKGKMIRKKLIEDIIKDKDITNAAKNYICSKNENRWIPIAINLRMGKILEILCHFRAKEIIKIRQK